MENTDRVFQGSIFLGDGFLLPHEEAEKLIEADPRNQEVIFPAINGQEINNEPNQYPGTSYHQFLRAGPNDRSAAYQLPFSIVSKRLGQLGSAQTKIAGCNRDAGGGTTEHSQQCYSTIRPLRHCFVAARTTKHLNFSAVPTNYVFTDALYIFTTDRWDLYAVVQSTLHEVWARKYSGALKQDLRYSPSNCFETFSFPEGIWQTANPKLVEIGERYHEHRCALMLRLWLGLTNIYNLFHIRDLTPAIVAKVSKKSQDEAEDGYRGILELRRLHRELDLAIRDAYGWSDLDLGHDFHEVETLPENDRVRYTISPTARKEVLRRLLALNHQRAAAQTAQIATASIQKQRARKLPQPDDLQHKLF